MLPPVPPNSRRMSGHQEGDVQDVDLVGKDVLLELVREHHDGVVGHRTADEDRHAAKYSGRRTAGGGPTGGIDRPTCSSVCNLAAMQDARISENGKPIERWRRKITGLKGSAPHDSGIAGKGCAMSQQSNGNVVAIGDHQGVQEPPVARRNRRRSSCRTAATSPSSAWPQPLSGMLDRVEDELFDLAEQAARSRSAERLLDARAQARDKRTLIEEHVPPALRRDASTARCAARPRARVGARGRAELTLVDEDELEETLAVEEMSRKLRDHVRGRALRAQPAPGLPARAPRARATTRNPLEPGDGLRRAEGRVRPDRSRASRCA